MSPTCHNITECDIDTGPHLSLCHRVWHCVTVTQILTMVPRVVSHSSGRLMASLMLVPPPPVLLQPLEIRQPLNARVARFCKRGRVTFAFELTKIWRLGDEAKWFTPTTRQLIGWSKKQTETQWHTKKEDSGDCLDDLTNCCPLSAPWERIHSFQSLPSFQFPVARNKQTAALQPICFVPRPSAHVMKCQSPKILIFFNLFLES